MIEVLTRVKALLAGSRPSDWAALSPADVIAVLDRELQSLADRGRLHDTAELGSLFAPTAEIQEISMANDWGDEYLRLSSGFDAALEDCT
jgi:hypothetical protein